MILEIKRTIKSYFAQHQRKGDWIGVAYSSAIEKKRERRYRKYCDVRVDKKLIVFESFMGRKYTDSPRAIFEYLQKNERFSDFEFVWCFREGCKEKYSFVAQNPRTSIVSWGSEEYYEAYAKAGYWFSNTRIPKAIKKRDGQTYVQCWHGTPLKKLGYDITTEATESKEVTYQVINSDVSRYSFLLSPSSYFTEKMSSALGLKELGKEGIVIEEGYPRNDFLSNYSISDKNRIKKALNIPENKKIILYAPTYRENQRKNSGYYYKEPIDYNSLKAAIGDEYVILFRAHYYISNMIDYDKYSDFIIDATDYQEVNDLYIVADILVTDYSSVFFDYGILKKPIIFYMYDLGFYRDELRGFYLSTDELPGPIIETQEDLQNHIVNSDFWFNTEEMKAKYEEFQNRFTYLEDGHATERVVERIFRK